MQPIINPMWIYLISFLGAIKAILGILSLIIIYFLLEIYKYQFREILKNHLGKIIIAIILGLLGIFIPTEKTATKMIIAKYVTLDNVLKGKKEVKNTIDYIFEKIKEKK